MMDLKKHFMMGTKGKTGWMRTADPRWDEKK
jgi:hypothetical protein